MDSRCPVNSDVRLAELKPKQFSLLDETEHFCRWRH